jgi:predicted DNA-binding protein
MKSLRLDPELERRLETAAAATGESVSEFIRNAAAVRADAVLEPADGGLFADVAGTVHGGGGNARRSGAAFADLLVEGPRKR